MTRAERGQIQLALLVFGAAELEMVVSDSKGGHSVFLSMLIDNVKNVHTSYYQTEPREQGKAANVIGHLQLEDLQLASGRNLS